MVNIFVRGEELWIEDSHGCTGVEAEYHSNVDALIKAEALKRFLHKYGIDSRISRLAKPQQSTYF